MKKLFLLKVFMFTLIALIIFLPSYVYAKSIENNTKEIQLINNENITTILEQLNTNIVNIDNNNYLFKTIKAPILPNQKLIKEAVFPKEEVKTFDEVKTVTTMNTKKEIEQVEEVKSKEITVTATAYTASCSGCSGITATGINLKKNPNVKVIAVDPKVIPLGSKVHVPGYGEAIAGDKGGAIKGNKIDVFIKDKSNAIKWGKQQVKITVYE